jgi:hypothetical protein
MKDSVIQWEEDELKAVELNERFQQKKGEGTEIKEKLDPLAKRNRDRKKS